MLFDLRSAYLLLIVLYLQLALSLRFYATTSPGLEKLLLKEVKALKDVGLAKLGKCGVHFSGTFVVNSQ